MSWLIWKKTLCIKSVLRYWPALHWPSSESTHHLPTSNFRFGTEFRKTNQFGSWENSWEYTCLTALLRYNKKWLFHEPSYAVKKRPKYVNGSHIDINIQQDVYLHIMIYHYNIYKLCKESNISYKWNKYISYL